MTRLLERYAGQYMVLVLLIAAGTWFATGNTAGDAGGAGGVLPLRAGAGRARPPRSPPSPWPRATAS